MAPTKSKISAALGGVLNFINAVQSGCNATASHDAEAGEVLEHHAYSQCFQEVDLLAVHIVADFSDVECHQCRGNVMVAYVQYEEFGHEQKSQFDVDLWIVACMPKVCLSWQAHMVIVSWAENRQLANAIIESPFKMDCVSLLRLPRFTQVDRQGYSQGRNASNIALCFVAQGKRLHQLRLQSLRNNVIMPFGLDVFAVIESSHDKQKIDEKMVRRFLQPLSINIELPRPFRDLESTMQGNLSRSAFKKLQRKFHPGLKGGLFALRHLQECYSLLEHEEMRRTSRYDKIVGVREDLLWLSPPPLHLMKGQYLWIPDGQDWGGFNDRWVVSGRDVAATWFRRWDLFVKGTIQKVLVRMSPKSMEKPIIAAMPAKLSIAGEIILARCLQIEGVCQNIRRVPSTAAVMCSQSDPTHRRESCSKEGFAYLSEVHDAHNIAARLEDEWLWSSSLGWRFQATPSYYDLCTENKGNSLDVCHYIWNHCCRKIESVEFQQGNPNDYSCAGLPRCFSSDALTHHRVCHAGYFGISLKPRSMSSRKVKSCWKNKYMMERDVLHCLFPPGAYYDFHTQTATMAREKMFLAYSLLAAGEHWFPESIASS